jgi:hypothetical protein
MRGRAGLVAFSVASLCAAAAGVTFFRAADVQAASPPPGGTSDVLADAPTDLGVTVYRAPYREAGSMDLDNLSGFALVRETRTIRLPAGESRIRFEGVADGIEPASAIVTGLAAGVLEKNRDASLLSPATLVAAAVGKPVTLLRSNPKTGRTERVPGTIVSDVDGVVFQTSSGVEALRCSGFPETFTYTPATGLSATPTLSVLVRTDRPMTQVITLSYLARAFDWSADYTATLSDDGKRLDLGAWLTLANGNGVSFPNVHTQIVAGRVNRESGEVEPIDAGGPVLAQCWPRGSTNDRPELLQIARAVPAGFEENRRHFPKDYQAVPVAASALQEVAVTGTAIQEQLGDLKLYRVPELTTVASRQSKQVRLLDRASIPFTRLYKAELSLEQIENLEASATFPVTVTLRTRNDAANHLGLPLPSGRVSVLERLQGTPLLLKEVNVRDLAVNEDVEINMGESADVEVKAVLEERTVDLDHSRKTPLVPGVVALREEQVSPVLRVEVSNARAADIQLELLPPSLEGARIVRADHKLASKNGRPMFRLTVPANGTATVRFQLGMTEVRPTSD